MQDPTVTRREKILESRHMWVITQPGKVNPGAKTRQKQKKPSNIFKGTLSHTGCFDTACEWSLIFLSAYFVIM